MKTANLNAGRNKLPSDLRSLILRQQRILQKIKKEDHHLLDTDSERIFLRECNHYLSQELADLNILVKGLMHSRSQA
ncbi:MAG: hypothetical protein ACRDE2_12730 [Chitinophagaceae bacterium]